MDIYCLFFLFKIYLIIVIRWVTIGFCWFKKFVDGIFWFRFSSGFAAWFSLSISSLCFKKSKVSQFELRLRSFCFREVSPLFFVPLFAPSFPLLLLNVFPGHHFFDFFFFSKSSSVFWMESSITFMVFSYNTSYSEGSSPPTPVSLCYLHDTTCCRETIIIIYGISHLFLVLPSLLAARLTTKRITTKNFTHT